MKIAVCGSSKNSDKEISRRAFEIGKELAKNHVLVLTGAGNGYPHEAAKGAFSVDGDVFGISPAKDEEEHKQKYGFPIDCFTGMEYTNMGIPGRNFPLIEKADGIILVSGQIGSLNEFTIAFHYSKPIGILSNSGGITAMLKEIAEICDKNGEKGKVVYSEKPKELVNLVLDKLK